MVELSDIKQLMFNVRLVANKLLEDKNMDSSTNNLVQELATTYGYLFMYIKEREEKLGLRKDIAGIKQHSTRI